MHNNIKHATWISLSLINDSLLIISLKFPNSGENSLGKLYQDELFSLIYENYTWIPLINIEILCIQLTCSQELNTHKIHSY